MPNPRRLAPFTIPFVALLAATFLASCGTDDDKELAHEIRATRPVGGEPIIPLGSLPGPGECRIWYPGRSPLEQPSSGACTDMLEKVPPGAWLVYRPEQTPQLIQIREYPVQAGGTVIVKNYDVRTGLLIDN